MNFPAPNLFVEVIMALEHCCQPDSKCRGYNLAIPNCMRLRQIRIQMLDLALEARNILEHNDNEMDLSAEGIYADRGITLVGRLIDRSIVFVQSWLGATKPPQIPVVLYMRVDT
jgi:hypothetical protein